MNCQVMLVDDHKLFRKGLRLIIESLNGYEVMGEAANGLEFLELLEHSKPDLVMLDIAMPEMDGIEATGLALAKCPGLKIIAISMFGDQMHYLKMVAAGVRGFLLKTSDLNEVKTALDTVANGGTWFARELLESPSCP